MWDPERQVTALPGLAAQVTATAAHWARRPPSPADAAKWKAAPRSHHLHTTSVTNCVDMNVQGCEPQGRLTQGQQPARQWGEAAGPSPFLSSMMNTLNLCLCKYLGSVSLPTSLPFAREETSSETVLYWFQLTDVHISVTQYLLFFPPVFFLSIPYSNSPFQKNQTHANEWEKKYCSGINMWTLNVSRTSVHLKFRFISSLGLTVSPKKTLFFMRHFSRQKYSSCHSSSFYSLQT